MFKDASTILTVLAFVVIGAILSYCPQVEEEDWLLRLALSLQLGGALGNLVDRLTIGHVTDFVSVGNFPVFNVAHASITNWCCTALPERVAERGRGEEAGGRIISGSPG